MRERVCTYSVCLYVHIVCVCVRVCVDKYATADVCGPCKPIAEMDFISVDALWAGVGERDRSLRRRPVCIDNVNLFDCLWLRPRL